MAKEYKVLHLFSGIGGAALGFQEAVEEYKGMTGRFRTVAGIDCDPEACQDFEMLTGAPAVEMDLFSRADYEAFHGCLPPAEWREAQPEDIFAAAGGEYPDVVFLSPQCKGFSALLPEMSARTEKYQALNRLVVHGLNLVIKAFCDKLPAVIMLENVPRITSRGKWLLMQVKRLLAARGYIFHEGLHDCGEIGGLGQRRKRYLLIARQPKKVSAFIFKAPMRKLKTIGQVIGPLPLPDDPEGGLMHRSPRLQWKTWVRLALIPAGGDWRDLEKIAPEQYRVKYIPRGGGPYGVQNWQKPGATVIGSASIKGSNAAAISDPRLAERDNRHPGVYRVVRYDEPGPCVTGTRFGSGAPAVADLRTGFTDTTHHVIYRIRRWEEPAGTVTGAMRPSNGAISISDLRFGCKCRDGTMGVQAWEYPSKTVTGTWDVHSGAAAVADPRVPGDTEQGVWVIISKDGTWHRPLTTWELMALQGFPVYLPDGPVVLAGKSNAKWRERIGNAVPPPAARAIAEQILNCLLVSEVDEWTLGSTGVWVIPEVDKIPKEVYLDERCTN